MAIIKRSLATLKLADLILDNNDVKNANDVNEALKGVLALKKISEACSNYIKYSSNK